MIWNHEAETMPRAARERLHFERLQATLHWAVEHVAFHRERLGAATIGALADLARLPFVRKTDPREQYPFGLLATPRREVIARCGGFTLDHPEIAALRQRGRRELRRATGLSVELTIVAPRTIPRSEGRRCV